MKRYALIICIGEYQYLPNLSKPMGDATAVYELLKAEGEFDGIQLLTGKKVTTEALQTELKMLLLQRAKNSDLLLYFTGHGFTVGDEFEQRGLFATYNCQVKQQNGLSFSWLNKLIKKAELSSLVMFLDCCESEYFIENALLEEALPDLAKKNCFFAAACRAFEEAYARKSEQHSLFTGAMLKALQQQDQGKITASDVYRYIEAQLKAEQQEPVYIGRGNSIPLLDYQRQEPVAATVNEECPYQGLRAFDTDTAQFFFGREDAIDDLIDMLGRSSFVPVIGASGSGKSSVVRAGLLLWAEQQGWRVLGPIKPGPRPLDRLQGAFDEVFSNREIGEIYDLIENEGLTAVLPRLPKGRYLLVIDQFEEVFTVCASKDRQRQFVGCITGISQFGDSPLKIVTTMRSDFVTPWLSSDALTKVIQNDAVWLGTLQNDPLKTAIEQPAQVQGYTVERELLALIENDVAKEENCLPLLEFALTQLWDERDRQKHTLTALAYRKMGQLRGALNQRAEQIYNETGENAQGFKTDLERDWCRRICLELVRIGPEGTDTRRRQQREDVLDKGKSEKEKEIINSVIETLIEGRLLVADKSVGDANQIIDIAHEALMNGWQRFANWREADRDRLRLLQRIKDSYEEWVGKNKDNNYLLQKGLLAEVRDRWPEIKADMMGGLKEYSSRSDEQEREDITQLKKALAETQLREERTRIVSLPPINAIDKTLLAVKIVGDSAEKLQGEVINPAQTALNHAWRKVCERLKWQGHTKPVLAVAFSPTGDSIISGSSDKTLHLWDLDGRQIGTAFQGHTDSVRSVAFSPTGNRIVSGSEDGTLRLWDLDGRQIGTAFQGHTGWVWSVAFSPTGDSIVSGSEDGTLRLWDLDGRQIGNSFQGHTNSVRSVAFSPTGDRVVSGSRDSTLRLWDLNGRQIGTAFQGHTGLVVSVAFSPMGDRIVSGSSDKTLRLWDLNSHQIGTAFQGHTGLVRSVAFSPTGNRIISGSRDNTLRLWDLNGCQIGEAFEGHKGWVLSVAFSPAGDRIVSGSDDKTLRLWDLEGRQIDEAFEGHTSSVYAVAFSPTGERIVSGSRDNTLRLWDLNGQQIGEAFQGHTNWVQSVAFSPAGDRIVSGSNDRTLRLWDLEGFQIGAAFKGHTGSVYAVAFSPTGDRIVSGSNDKTLRLWDLDGRQIGNPFQGKNSSVYAVAFSSTGERIVSGSSDSTLRLWDLDGRQIGNPFQGHTSSIYAVAFSPTGDHIVSGSNDGTLRLWDLESRQIGNPFQGHTSSVDSVAFSPSGDHIVSSSRDKTLRLWDLDGRQIGAPFQGHIDEVNAIAFSPGGVRIVSGSTDSTLRLWPGGTWRDWLHTCCDRLMRHTRFTQPTSDDDRQACQVCEKYVWTQTEIAQFRIAQGDALARQGDTDGAIAKYTEAQALDESLTFNANERVRETMPVK